MIKYILVIVLTATLFPCSEEDNSKIEIIGNWQLIKMSGGFSNAETTGSDMER